MFEQRKKNLKDTLLWCFRNILTPISIIEKLVLTQESRYFGGLKNLVKRSNSR